ncbi:MAG TPA: hypothetical protein VGP72_20480 [Planctomycetota bacterium]|jgi:hypothetical protein
MRTLPLALVGLTISLLLGFAAGYLLTSRSNDTAFAAKKADIESRRQHSETAAEQRIQHLKTKLNEQNAEFVRLKADLESRPSGKEVAALLESKAKMTQDNYYAGLQIQGFKNDLREAETMSQRLRAELDRLTREGGPSSDEPRLATEPERKKAGELRKRRQERQITEVEISKVAEERSKRAAEDLGKLVVEAEWSGSFSCFDNITSRRLLAWRKGDLYDYTRAQAALFLTRVISGPEPQVRENSSHQKLLDVYFLNEVALALKQCKQARGRWALMPLPDGTHAVTELKDTPFALNADEIRKPILDCAEDLTSGDPTRQFAGLRMAERGMNYILIPHIIRLLDNLSPADGRTIGNEAAQALHHLFGQLSRAKERPPETKADWERWWRESLTANPFPKVEVAPGELRKLIEVNSQQAPSEICVDPRGRMAIITTLRQNPPVPVRAAIRLLNLTGDNPNDDCVYKAPEKDRNREPFQLAAAFTNNRVGIAWNEFYWEPTRDTVFFMTVDPATRQGTPVELKLKRVRRMAVCPLPKDRWLLASSYIPAGAEKLNPPRLEHKLLVLNDAGETLEQPAPLQLPGEKYKAGEGTVMALEQFNGGVAAAVVQDSELHLFLLDENVAPRKCLKIGRSTSSGRIGHSGDTLCVLWLQNGLLHASTLNTTGENLSAPQQISTEETHTFAGPAPVTGGFAVLWHDKSETPYQIRLARVALDGAIGERRVLYDANGYLEQTALGGEGDLVRAVFYDYSGLPRKIWLKQVDLSRGR